MKTNTTAPILTAFLAIFFQAQLLAGAPLASDPPFLLDPAPADTITVACLKDVPLGQKLNFDDDEGAPNFPTLIAPVDSPPADSINPCTGGQIMRTWTATDSENNTTVIVQIIIVLPDVAAPVTTAAIVNDTLPCEAINYNTWISSVRLAFTSNTTDNCYALGMGLSITDDAPPTRPLNCNTLTVTFTAQDVCNNQLQWQARLTATDTTPPVLMGIPPTDTVDCGQSLPLPPLVTATDNCGGEVDIVLNEVNNRSVDPSSCGFYQYEVVRTWTATDSCGNSSTANQIIRVIDRFAPDFTRPANISILCTDDPNDLNLTGNISNVTDNCSAAFAASSYQDAVTPGDCPGEYTIQRFWSVRDACNNMTVKIQTITVMDTVPPTFTVPADTTIRCDQLDNPSVTGSPTGVSDNCHDAAAVSFDDVILPGACLNSYTIRRTWTATDSCGNASSQVQMITVSDEIAPTIENQAQNLTVFCSGGVDFSTAFNQWLSTRGGAAAFDNCTFSEDLVWTAYDNGTNDPASLPAVMCPTGDSVLLTHIVRFEVMDECGNRDSTFATFRVIDNQAPVFSLCPPDVVVSTDPGSCDALVAIEPPLIEEGCGFGLLFENSQDEQPITTNAAPGQEGTTPVNPIQLNIPIGLPLPINASGPATLTVNLFSADAEGPTEYFDIFAEDGTFLGITAPTPAQCGDSERTFSLTVEQLNAWAADGTVGILLTPNIPANMSGAFAVNAVCVNPGSARARLSYTARDLQGLRYEFSIDDGPRTLVDPPAPVPVSLDQGTYLVTYYLTDCAGNQDSCAHFITVEDLEPPVLTCPADIQTAADPEACSATIALPFPTEVSDNCAAGNLFSQTRPSVNADAFITFEYDPNLNDYVAQAKTYTFNGVAANAAADALVTIVASGDFNTNGAFVNILGEDNSVLGSTTVGFTNCNDAAQVSFTIPRADFNAWAADGLLSIQVVPNAVPVPPGVPGDGINPCNPAEVTFDGDNDGVSYIFATLEYSALEVNYFSQGATVLPLSVITDPAAAPEHEFRVGETQVYYVIRDRSGNADTCSFNIVVQDTQAPVALCQPTIVFVNPSGVADQVISPALIDAGSTDNCGIASRTLSPATFNCLQAGNSFPITMTVADSAGNTASCSTTIRIEIESPQPTANSGICGGDTLFLFANPPAAQGGVIYTFLWSGPQGFTSTLENPVIPNIDPSRAGSYSVTITGITGCTASASVEVAIESLPLVPTLLTDTEICINEDIVLTSSVTIPGPGAVYNWYEGIPPNGVLLTSTSSPQLILPGPHPVGQRQFYLILESGPCITSPSLPVAVTVSPIPVAIVNTDQITICQGQPLQLGTGVSGPGVTYQWVGPNFMSANQSPVVTNSAGPGSGGIYTLRITQNGCISPPDTTIVTVLPKPATPLLSSSGPACEGGTILLTASTPASLYRWIPPGGGTPIVTTAGVLLLQNVDASVAGPWRVFVTQFGCDSDLSAPLQVVVNPVPQVMVEVSTQAVCEGQSLQLFASPALINAQYIWSGPAGFSSAQRTPVIADMSPARAGTYSVTVTTAEGCSGTASVQVEVLNRPAITGLSNNGPECISGPIDVQLTATLSPPDNGSYTYEWSGPCPVMASGSDAIIPGATTACNGAYQLIVRNASGCPSLPAVTFVNMANAPSTPGTPVITSGNASAVCAGQPLTLTTTTFTGNSVTYFWQTPAGTIPTATASLAIGSVSIADSGPYSVFVEVDGCLSGTSGLINVVVNPVPVIVGSSNSPVCEGQPIQFMSTFIPGASYQWIGLNNAFTSSVPNPVINNADSILHSGAYTIMATRNGCMSDADTVFVEVRRRPMRPIALPVAPVCISTPGAVALFSVAPGSATPGATYDWFDQNNMQVGVSAGLTFQFNNFAPYGEGTFPFFVRARKDGCISGLSEPVFVTFNTIPAQPPFAGEDAEVCPNLDIFLNATAPPRGTGLWTLVQGGTGNESIVSPGMPASQVTGLLMEQSYTFRWTLSNGACVNYAFDEVTLNVRELEAVFAGSDTIICPGTSFQLYAAPVELDSGRWSQPDVQALLGISIGDNADPASPVTGMTSGNLYVFVWTVSGECGSRADSVFVSVSDVQPSAGDDFRACNDEQFAVLRAQTPGLGSFGNWSSPDTTLQFSDPQDPEATVSGLKPGFNTLVWSIDDALCGSASVDTVIVEYTLNPAAEDDEFEVDFGQPTYLDVLANDFRPEGTVIRIIEGPGSGAVVIENDTVPIYTPGLNFIGSDQFMYEICSEGCECSVATVFIDVVAGDLCNVPSVITPNGDKINDALVIPCLFDTGAYPNSQVLVFNRWGDEVFRSSIPYRNNWEGTYNGQELPPGTYFYILNFGDGTVPRRGFLMILR